MQCEVEVEGHARTLFCLDIKRRSDTLGSAHSLFYRFIICIYICFCSPAITKTHIASHILLSLYFSQLRNRLSSQPNWLIPVYQNQELTFSACLHALRRICSISKALWCSLSFDFNWVFTFLEVDSCKDSWFEVGFLEFQRLGHMDVPCDLEMDVNGEEVFMVNKVKILSFFFFFFCFVLCKETTFPSPEMWLFAFGELFVTCLA